MPRERKTAPERRHQVGLAALSLLAEHGASALTTSNIARQAGIKDGSLFRHFASKEDIVSEAVGLFEDAMRATFPPPTLPPVERLRRLFLARARLARERPDVVRLAFSERLLEAAAPTDVARVRAMVQRSLSFVERCIDEARAEGSIVQDVPAKVLTWSVIGVLRGLVLSALDGQATPMTPEAAWDAVLRLLRRPAAAPSARS